MFKLNNANLPQLPATIPSPVYDRSRVTTGIVHFGVGGFHRAHQAMYLDALMNQGRALDWGICGVGVLPADRRMAAVMAAQDGLYTLVLKHHDGRLEPRVIGSIVDYKYAPDDPESVLETLVAATTRIVSLTVTEGGYNFHHVSGEFDFANPAVQHDLQAGATPTTTFGFVAEALRRRRERGIAPFTVMSCDNIQGNGDMARKMFVAFAGARDAELGAWMDANVVFPNCMVDRITPVTTEQDRAEVTQQFGIDDAWPVICEPFTQWVLEDDFSLGRPAYEQVGAQMVADVMPYELMKLRLLNASHQALAYFGHLAGYYYAHDACQDPLLSRFLMAYMTHEGQPTLAALPGVDLEDYKRTLIQRFSNPGIRDTIARLCAESSDRIPKWLLPVVREQLQTGGDIHRSAAIVASWARYAEGVDEHGEPIEIVDRLADSLHAIALHNRDNPTTFIENRELFGDLVDNERFVTAYTHALQLLHEQGARATLRQLLSIAD